MLLNARAKTRLQYPQNAESVRMNARHDATASTSKYIPGAEIRKRFQVSNGTLQRWANEGRVDSVRLKSSQGKRLYKEDDLDNVIAGFKVLADKELGHRRAKVCYARVSSAKQKEDLQRQVELLRREYPDHEIVKDVGSGINWKRVGFTSVLDRVMHGDVQEVVVSHRDRLCRFAFDLVKRVFENAGCKLVVHDETARGRDGVSELESAETELRDDLLAIVTVFVASSNGRRAAAHRRERRERAEQEAASKKATEEGTADEEDEHSDEGPCGKVHEVQDIPGLGAASDAQTVGGRDEVDLQQGSREAQLEETGNEGIAFAVEGVGRDGGRDVEKGGRRDAEAVLECPVRDTGLAAQGHSRRMHFAQKQRKSAAPQTQVPPEKRRRVVHHHPPSAAQLQDGPGMRVAATVRDGEL